jgi:hypothetical protein
VRNVGYLRSTRVLEVNNRCLLPQSWAGAAACCLPPLSCTQPCGYFKTSLGLLPPLQASSYSCCWAATRCSGTTASRACCA